MGVMVRCPHTFGQTVYRIVSSLGWFQKSRRMTEKECPVFNLSLISSGSVKGKDSGMESLYFNYNAKGLTGVEIALLI